MPWFCDNCGERLKGSFCKCGAKNASATRCPPLDGFVFFAADGTGITRVAQREYDMEICKKGKFPEVTQGVHPPGWNNALEHIGRRALRILEEKRESGYFQRGF